MRLSRVLLISISCALCSCSKTVGTYYWTGNKIGPDALELVINSDGTFQYRTWSDILGADTVHGRWMLRSDTVVLEGNTMPTLDCVRIEEGNIDTLSGMYFFSLRNEDGDYLLGAEMVINKEESIVISDESYVATSELPRLISVEYLSSEFIIDKLDFENYNKFDIYIDFEVKKLSNFVLNSKWLKKGRKLIQIDEKGNIVGNGIYRKRY